jgi:hypothetical protein
MALQVSGPIDANDIRSEFGATNGTSVSFGAYRVSQTVSALTNMPLDAGIPQSGPIKFSDFYNKRLNVVVDYTVGVGTTTRVTARTDYDANNSKIVVIGNFRQRPVSPAATKVWVHTNGDVGSNIKTNTREYCSLRTGTWDSTTDLQLDIGPNGRVAGAGGDGGSGGDASGQSSTAGSNGNNGTSAIGIQHAPILITNRGTVISGFGGGGGGGGGWGQDRDANIFNDTIGLQTINVAGSGGGGGRGLPGGSGGLGGNASSSGSGDYTTAGYPGNVGNTGNILGGGKGGNAVGQESNSNSNAIGGAGGGGSDAGLGGDQGNAGGRINASEASASVGTPGTLSQGGTGGTGAGDGDQRGGDGSGGGSGGFPGYAIIVNNVGTGVTITNTGTIIGITTYSTIPV